MSAKAMAARPVDRAGGHILIEAWNGRYRRPLLRFFQRRLPSSADREDLVQEVFLKLSRQDNLAEIERVDCYLFGVAANVLKDWHRKQQTHAAASHQPLHDAIQDAGASAERVVLARDALRLLVERLNALPERTRAIFQFYHFDHLPHAEIGRRLGIAVRTVEDHMARANLALAAGRHDDHGLN